MSTIYEPGGTSPGTIQQLQSTSVPDLYLPGYVNYGYGYWNVPTRENYWLPYWTPYPGYDDFRNPFIYDYMYY